MDDFYDDCYDMDDEDEDDDDDDDDDDEDDDDEKHLAPDLNRYHDHSKKKLTFIVRKAKG